MNDRFRFRAWDKKNKNFIFDIEDENKRDWEITELEQCRYFGEYFLMPERYIVEQCTGLKDKNGRRIYEGDFLINHDGKIGFIEFKNACFMLTAINEDNIMSTQDWTECEVIGNIHENAYLLEAKNEQKEIGAA